MNTNDGLYVPLTPMWMEMQKSVLSIIRPIFSIYMYMVDSITPIYICENYDIEEKTLYIRYHYQTVLVKDNNS